MKSLDHKPRTALLSGRTSIVIGVAAVVVSGLAFWALRYVLSGDFEIDAGPMLIEGYWRPIRGWWLLIVGALTTIVLLAFWVRQRNRR